MNSISMNTWLFFLLSDVTVKHNIKQTGVLADQNF